MAVHDDIAHELVQLAAFVRANPNLADDLSFTFNRLLIPVSFREKHREIIAAFARAGKASQVEVTKSFDDEWGGVLLTFGRYVGLHVYAHREQVCERIVTGTREVEEEIPDPGAPKIKRIRTEEIVEWQCAPLLAEEVSA
jgi:hypothetical protein